MRIECSNSNCMVVQNYDGCVSVDDAAGVQMCSSCVIIDTHEEADREMMAECAIPGACKCGHDCCDTQEGEQCPECGHWF